MQPLILPYKGIMPNIADDVFIAPNAVIIGDVTIGAGSSIWFGAVIRGDVMPITIGERTNIQDNSVIHVTRKIGPTVIGSGVTIGHAVMLHACTIEDDCFIGMRAVMLDHSTVKQGGMLAAGAVLTPRKIVGSGELWAGSPAALMRPMRQEESDFIPISADNYVRLAKDYL
ncbi:MAG: gamma carbonic anhydrase family protein [Alphaproteobacteria bacterium]|nr:MAG: gamma carbonic anhydrase family protein [Alphaproteobacteria bacterium]TAF15580.1 MAG: gamma carbonic anhydrase family protein [Alphaproteobacteria bacterium]TAF41984.1 MAG: gamma carbonic anhydrase family protein [Alphaproteobacteria bacterium]TAF76592.1 MAG: gamma carbonic anhydrase family protein [Alphaproteobacteria bacterium]